MKYCEGAVASVMDGMSRDEQDRRVSNAWQAIAGKCNDTTFPDDDTSDDMLATFCGEHELVDIFGDAFHRVAERPWRIIKDKMALFKRTFAVVYGRWSASGQGDPNVSFADFVHEGDPYGRAVRAVFELMKDSPLLAFFHRQTPVAADSASAIVDLTNEPNEPRGRRVSSVMGGLTSTELTGILAPPPQQALLLHTQRLAAMQEMRVNMTFAQELQLNRAIGADLDSL